MVGYFRLEKLRAEKRGFTQPLTALIRRIYRGSIVADSAVLSSIDS